ncbi:glycogen synthase GlgA [Marinobacter sp.]|uniref:glycogen synthase GlgA n=1 Tax=Marinobacter sp. TaxID=50741 RepID=UPI003A909A19
MIRVLFATSEVYPLVKTGGLADVSASLPEALCRLEYDVHILLPGYPAAMEAARSEHALKKASIQVGEYGVSIWQTRLPGSAVTLWLVDCPALFDRPGNPYQNSKGEDWWDNAQRYELFCRVAAQIALGQAGIHWTPDIVHCNDWQTGLIPVFLERHQRRPGTVFTIHNLAYQGLFPQEIFRALALPDSLWNMHELEFHGQLSFIKGGLVFADRITTVSPGYAREIQTPEYGYGLDGLLQHRRDRLSGILNGIDTRVWNPEDDPCQDFHYSRDSLENKLLCKARLQEQLGLAPGNAPLLGFIGRMVEQKGLDWLVAGMPSLLKLGCQFALLGSGETRYEEPLKALAQQWPDQVSLTLGYDEVLSHRITAGCDLFVMPSRFEPCGLNQMYSLRYGTLPVVHSVGGLKNTVFDPSDVGLDEANGFSFQEPTARSFLSAIERALEYRDNQRAWRRMQHNAMSGEYSWRLRAKSYGDLYQQVLAEARQ